MKQDVEQIFETAKKMSLTGTEKNNILNHILGGETLHTVRKEESERLHTIGGMASLTGYYPHMSILRYRVLSSLTVIVVLLGTTGAYAQMSLPGELLYPIKIHVNEKVEYLTALTPKAQALVEATFAGRRLEEASALLYSDKLTPSKSTELAAQFSAHTENLVGHLSELRKRGDDKGANEINTLFVSSIESHQNILNVFEASSSFKTILNGKLLNATNGTTTQLRLSGSTTPSRIKEGKFPGKHTPIMPIVSSSTLQATTTLKATTTKHSVTASSSLPVSINTQTIDENREVKNPVAVPPVAPVQVNHPSIDTPLPHLPSVLPSF